MRVLFVGLFCLSVGFGIAFISKESVMEQKPIAILYGIASHYGMGDGFHGRCMADGRFYNKDGMTAAHKSLPLGAKVRVKYHARSVLLTITDRGPYKHGRVIDLSEAGARALGLIEKGIDRVTIEVLEQPLSSQKYHHQNPACLKKFEDTTEQYRKTMYAKTQ